MSKNTARGARVRVVEGFGWHLLLIFISTVKNHGFENMLLQNCNMVETKHTFLFSTTWRYANGVKVTPQILAKKRCFFNFQATRVVPNSSKHAIVDCRLSLLFPLLDFRSQIGQITLPSQILNIEI